MATCTCKSFAAVSVLTVVCLIVCLVLLSTMPDLPRRTFNTELCLPLTETGDAVECGGKAMSVHIVQIIDHALKKLESDYQEENEKDTRNAVKLKTYLKHNYFPMKPSVHMTGSGVPSKIYSVHKTRSEIPDDPNQTLVTIKEWNHGYRLHDNGGFQRNGIQYRHGRLVVPVAGYYSVYSYISIYQPRLQDSREPDNNNSNTTMEPGGSHRHGTFIHAIYKSNILTSNETELFSAIQPRLVKSTDHFSVYTSYIQSVVHLNIGDELFVKISNGTYLRFPEHNYFGLTMI